MFSRKQNGTKCLYVESVSQVLGTGNGAERHPALSTKLQSPSGEERLREK